MRRHVLVLVTASALFLAISGCERPAPKSASSAPWKETTPRSDGRDGISVLLAYDMEGVSGIDDWRMFDANFPEYKRGRELLTQDVNAVIDGLFAGGATRVDIVDFHGSGSSNPDVLVEQVDARAPHIQRESPFWEFDLVEAGEYDAIAIVGMHCKPGTRGFAPHTCGYATEILIHGRTITEAEWLALLWGEVGVPVIFVCGDDRLKSDLSTMPWIEYVVVKNSTSASTVTLRPTEEVHAELKAAAARAVAKISSSRAMVSRTPLEVGVRANPPTSLEALEGVPGVDYRDGAVYFTAPSLVKAGPGINAILNIAGKSLAPIAYEKLDSLMGLDPSLRAFYTKVTERWLGFQSGTWAPAAEDSVEAGTIYHGAE